MGTTVNGARTFLNILHKACKLSHMNGFVTGLRGILGTEVANDVYALWTPLCSLIEVLVANDNYFNQIDYVREDDVGEDIGGA
jgi:hypothetical protein